MTDVDDAAAAFLSSLGQPSGGAAAKKNKKKAKKKPNNAAAAAEEEVEKVDVKEATAEDLTKDSENKDTNNQTVEDSNLENEASAVGAGKKAAAKKKGKAKAEPKISAMGKLAAQRLEKQRLEQERIAAEEAERKRIEDEERRKEEERLRAEEERKRIAKEKKKAKKEELKKQGKLLTKAQKAKEQKAKLMREQLIASGRIKVDKDGKPLHEEEDESDALNFKADALHEPTLNSMPATDVKSSISKDAVNELVNGLKAVEVGEQPISMAGVQEVEKTPARQEEKLKDFPEIEQNVTVESWEDLGDNSWEQLDFAAENKRFGDEVSEVDASETKAELGTTSVSQDVHTDGDKKMKKSKPKSNQVDENEFLQAIKDKKLRSPIVCVMGHVDTGKTKLLDKLRHTNVQDNEAGGITQQIGSTFFPIDRLRVQTDPLNVSENLHFDYKIPGILMIDTPGHESFSNLRKRGSNLSDIAILVVDLMHGLEQQTIESINLLRQKRTAFVVALNKIDRLYAWKKFDTAKGESPNIRECLARQSDSVLAEFENRTKEVIVQLNEQGLNAKLYYENDDYRRVVSLVPTSAHTGEGIPDLLMLLIQLTQKQLHEKLILKPEVECNIMEVKKIEGIGTSIDCLLVNGRLTEGDQIVLATLNGPIKTQIKALLTPQPLKEMRIKSNYIHHKSIAAAMGIKIVAPNLEEALPGTRILVYDKIKDKHTNGEHLEELKESVMEDIETILKSIDTSGIGVCVQASTLGALEALVDYLRSQNVPINSVNIGEINKKDVIKASTMLDHRRKEFAVILAFDVTMSKEAKLLSDKLGVEVFTADIIYHLYDNYKKFSDAIIDERRQNVDEVAVFPCILQIIPENVFMKKNPLVFGVEVLEGIVKIGTPIAVPEKLNEEGEMLTLGKVASIEKDHKEANLVKKGSKVCIKIMGSQSESYVQYGRHFDHKNLLYSKVSRESIDALKENFKNDLDKTDWVTVIKLKKIFNIQ